MSEKSQALASLAGRIRQQRPLVHHITNMVVMNDTANITLAIGASPVMAHALEEVGSEVDRGIEVTVYDHGEGQS